MLLAAVVWADCTMTVGAVAVVSRQLKMAAPGMGGAQIRVLVRRFLRKYGYPPDKQEKATQTVLE